MAWKFHAIEQTQLRKARRVDGVGRPIFDFHTAVALCLARLGEREGTSDARTSEHARTAGHILGCVNLRA